MADRRPESRENAAGTRRRAIRFRTSLRNTVLDVLEAQRGWLETDSEFDWDLHWADVGWVREHLDAFTPLQDHQVASTRVIAAGLQCGRC